MKKAVVTALAITLAFAAVGCSSKKEPATEAKTEAKTEAAKTEEVTEKQAAAEEAVSEAVEAASEAVEGVKEAASEAADLGEGISEAVKEADEAVSEAVKEADEAVSEVAEEVKEGISEAAEAVEEKAEEVISEVSDTAGKAAAAVTATAKAAADSAKEDISEVADQAEEKISEVADAAEEIELPERDKPYKAAVLIPGTLGDKSFWDSTNEGLTALNKELGDDMFQFTIMEMGAGSADMSSYPDFFLDACESEDYDVIISGSWTTVEALTEAMEEYPDQKFILFDEGFDYSSGKGKNLYNLLFEQNELSFLVGACAELLSESGTICFLGGMEGNVINDFLVGYIQGALEVNPDAKVAVSFVGNYEDSAKGKDLSLAMFNAGADVGFNVAGAAGMGILEAAKEAKKLAFGVDSDQAGLNPDLADYIPTSGLKNVGASLAQAIKKDMAGKLEYGKAETYGFAENGVELLDDDHYREMVPEEIREQVAELQEKIISGEIVVNTTAGENGMDAKAIEELKASVAVK